MTTGSYVTRGGTREFICSTAQPCHRSLRLRYATKGPVSIRTCITRQTQSYGRGLSISLRVHLNFRKCLQKRRHRGHCCQSTNDITTLFGIYRSLCIASHNLLVEKHRVFHFSSICRLIEFMCVCYITLFGKYFWQDKD